MKRSNKIPNPYTLAWRYMRNDGQWSEWSINEGQFFDWETVRKQMGILCRGRKHHRFEFRITYNGKNYNQNGVEILDTFTL